MTTLKRGMKRWSTNQIALKFSHYVNLPALPPVPKSFGHVKNDALPTPGGWGMLGNDKYGDCTVAGIAHGQDVLDLATKKQIPRFTDQNIIDQYLALSGGVDSGLDPVAVADYWRSPGLADADGSRHMITAYTAIDNPNTAITAAYLFGFSGLGLSMPDNAEVQFDAGHTWDDITGDADPNEGHFVPLVGRNSKGDLMVVTWGRLQACSPAWIEKYFAGAIGYISQDYFLSTGLSPEGFNIAQLNADLADVTSSA
jgi:hypothetical protein